MGTINGILTSLLLAAFPCLPSAYAQFGEDAQPGEANVAQVFQYLEEMPHRTIEPEKALDLLYKIAAYDPPTVRAGIVRFLEKNMDERGFEKPNVHSKLYMLSRFYFDVPTKSETRRSPGGVMPADEKDWYNPAWPIEEVDGEIRLSRTPSLYSGAPPRSLATFDAIAKRYPLRNAKRKTDDGLGPKERLNTRNVGVTLEYDPAEKDSKSEPTVSPATQSIGERETKPCYNNEQELLASLADAKSAKVIAVCPPRNMSTMGFTLQTDTGKELEISITNPGWEWVKEDSHHPKSPSLLWKWNTKWTGRAPASAALVERLLALIDEEGEGEKNEGLRNHLIRVRQTIEAVSTAFDEALAGATALRFEEIRATAPNTEQLDKEYQFTTDTGAAIILTLMYPYYREEIRVGKKTEYKFTHDKTSPYIVLSVSKTGVPTTTANGQRVEPPNARFLIARGGEIMLSTREQLARLKLLIEKAAQTETDKTKRTELEELLAAIAAIENTENKETKRTKGT